MPPKRSKKLDLSLDPETRKGIAVVFLFAAAIFMLLAIFNLGGALGKALNDGLGHVFGWDKILLPFVFIVWGYHVVAPDKLPMRFVNVLGIILLFISLNGLVHTWSFPGIAVPDSVLQSTGGKLGQTVSLPITNILGLAGGVTVLVALLIASILLTFNATLSHIVSVATTIGNAVAMLLRAIAFPYRKWQDAKVRKQVAAPAMAPIAEESEEGEEDGEEDPSTSSGQEGDEESEEETEEGEEEEEEVEVTPPPKPKKKQPKIEIPFELLERRDTKPTFGDINHNKEMIRRTLEKFGIPVEMNDVAVGPTVTQFTLKPADGIKLAKITGLHNDLALSLAAHPIRIEAPIPGKSLVGIEVPNHTVATVGMREILESKEFKERKSNMHFVLGKDVSGKPLLTDLARMPHLLVAGATGSGKSVCLNVLIMSMLYANGPDELKLVMVDPKRVELQVYNGIPHLVTPVITKVPETVNALKWGLREMDRRYDLLAKFGSRDIASYNARVEDKLPYVVFVVDELADLMATAAAEVEGPIVRLAQMSRAVGIHLVVATQRPSVDVITGLIKANIPGRIAFAVASSTDSRTILDQTGAEKLLGRGDMLITSAEIAVPKRIQGAFIAENEISRVVEYIKSKYEPADYDVSVTERSSFGPTFFKGDGEMDDEDSDPMCPMAKEEIIRAGKASASLLQRRLKVGYARAARILDLLEQEGFIGPADGAKPREILKADFTKQMPTVPRPVNAPTKHAPVPIAPEPEEEEEEDEDEEEEGTVAVVEDEEEDKF